VYYRGISHLFIVNINIRMTDTMLGFFLEHLTFVTQRVRNLNICYVLIIHRLNSDDEGKT